MCLSFFVNNFLYWKSRAYCCSYNTKRINMYSSIMFMSFIVYKKDKLYIYKYTIRYPCNVGRTAPLLPLVYKTETSTLTIRERKSLIVPGTYKNDQSPVVMVVAIIFFQNAAACADNAAYSCR